jgi:sRNA-binding regulator protein Hfq
MKSVKEKKEDCVPQKKEAETQETPVSNVAPQERRRLPPPQFTGKELQRLYEWVENKDQIKIKLVNGEMIEGYLKWNDQSTVKLVGKKEELIVPKRSILYYVDLPRSKK